MVKQNVRGARAGKLDEVKAIKDNCGVDVIAITISWCTSSAPDGPPSRCRGSTFTGGTDKMAANTEVSPAMCETQFQLNTAPN